MTSCGASNTRSRRARNSRSRGRCSISRRSSGFSTASSGCGLPIVVGIWPFESALNAEFMANEVPGVRVPDALVQRMRAAGAARRRRTKVCALRRSLAHELVTMVQGLHVASPGGNLSLALVRWTESGLRSGIPWLRIPDIVRSDCAWPRWQDTDTRRKSFRRRSRSGGSRHGAVRQRSRTVRPSQR